MSLTQACLLRYKEHLEEVLKEKGLSSEYKVDVVENTCLGQLRLYASIFHPGVGKFYSFILREEDVKRSDVEKVALFLMESLERNEDDINRI